MVVINAEGISRDSAARTSSLHRCRVSAFGGAVCRVEHRLEARLMKKPCYTWLCSKLKMTLGLYIVTERYLWYSRPVKAYKYQLLCLTQRKRERAVLDK